METRLLFFSAAPTQQGCARAEYVPCAAFCSGVHCVTSRVSTAAPAASSLATVSAKPQPAHCNCRSVYCPSACTTVDCHIGVRTFAVMFVDHVWLKLQGGQEYADASHGHPTCTMQDGLSVPAAMCNGVLSALSRASTGHPAASRPSSSSVCPEATAKCSAVLPSYSQQAQQ